MLAGIIVNLVVPLMGLGFYLWLCREMWQSQIPLPPFISYFFLFVNFGGCLLVLLTAFFWEWSGMASIGTVYLMLISPFISAAVAWALYSRREASWFHRAGFAAAVIYLFLLLIPFCAVVGHLVAG